MNDIEDFKYYLWEDRSGRYVLIQAYAGSNNHVQRYDYYRGGWHGIDFVWRCQWPNLICE